jgi:hypothetical protein
VPDTGAVPASPSTPTRSRLCLLLNDYKARPGAVLCTTDTTPPRTVEPVTLVVGLLLAVGVTFVTFAASTQQI